MEGPSLAMDFQEKVVDALKGGIKLQIKIDAG
jgi:hypothetical protein